MKKLATLLAFSLAVGKANAKVWEKYFIPSCNDTITIHNLGKLKRWLIKKGWDGKSVESLIATLNRISFPRGNDEEDRNITWEDKVSYGGVCTQASTFLYSALKSIGKKAVLAVVAEAIIHENDGKITDIISNVPTNWRHMVVFTEEEGGIFAGSENLSRLTGRELDNWPISSFTTTSAVVIYPLPKNPMPGEGSPNRATAWIRKLASKNGYLLIYADEYPPREWERKIWPMVWESLKKGMVIIIRFGRREKW